MARTRQQRAGRRRTGPERRPTQAPARPRPDPEVLPAPYGPRHPRPDRGVPLLGRLLRRAGPGRARRRIDSRQAGRMGPGPLPGAGGKPGFSLAAPSGEAPAKTYRHVHGFVPNIPHKLASPAGHALAGEGAWRVLETVKGSPAIFGTFLRPSAVYSSYVAGLVSMDQRLVKFRLRPGAEDPGRGNWKASTWIPPGTRMGLLATFNGGFKLDSAGGGFYLNGAHKGALVRGAASVVYYRDGTIKIGSWGHELRMTPDVVGVRQNLKLLGDHGKVPATVDQNVNTTWG